jgi:hypothetical protein
MEEEDTSAVETPDATSIAADKWLPFFEPAKEPDDSLGVLIAQLGLETDIDKAQIAKLFSRIAALSGSNTSGTALDVLRIILLPMLIALSKADNLSKYMTKSASKNELSRLQEELTPLLTWK